jgi:hypothetical protein
VNPEAIVRYNSQLIHDLQRDENEIAELLLDRGLRESIASIYMVNRKNFHLMERLIGEEIYKAILEDADRLTKQWKEDHG